MPRFTRKSRRRNASDEADIVQHLIHGRCLGCLIKPSVCTITEDDLEEGWERHRAEILERWAKENRDGNPWGWHQFEGAQR